MSRQIGHAATGATFTNFTKVVQQKRCQSRYYAFPQTPAFGSAPKTKGIQYGCSNASQMNFTRDPPAWHSRANSSMNPFEITCF